LQIKKRGALKNINEKLVIKIYVFKFLLLVDCFCLWFWNQTAKKKDNGKMQRLLMRTYAAIRMVLDKEKIYVSKALLNKNCIYFISDTIVGIVEQTGQVSIALSIDTFPDKAARAVLGIAQSIGPAKIQIKDIFLITQGGQVLWNYEAVKMFGY